MKRAISRAAAALSLSLLVAAPTRAAADAGPKLPERAFYISPGLNLGGTSTFDVGTGFHLGGEVTALYWHKMLYFGALVDGLYDWKRDAGRMSFGGVAGWGPIGIDGGYLMEVDSGGPYHGGTIRLFFSMGIAALYLRYGGLKDRPDFLEWGVLIKVPLAIWSVYPQRPRPRPQRRIDGLPGPPGGPPRVR